MGDWDGVVDCEVLAAIRRACCAIPGRAARMPIRPMASRLNSTVTWTLTAVEGGTLLKMVHDGFEFPGNRFAFDVMSPGWGRALDRIGELTAEG